jgi:hypothetical protein
MSTTDTATDRDTTERRGSTGPAATATGPTTDYRDADSRETTGTTPIARAAARLIGYGLVLCLLASTPVAAAENASSFLCEAEKLPAMIEAVFRLTTVAGVIGLITVWQGSAFLEVFTLSPEQKLALKNHRRKAFKSTLILVSIGPLFSVVGPSIGLPLASCINLVPW